MDTKFQPTNETPLAALTIGQFKELIVTMVQPQPIIQTKQEFSTDTFGKKVCEKKIPYYKKNARVIFKRNEIEDWLLSNRIQTVEEFIEEKENQFCNGRSTR